MNFNYLSNVKIYPILTNSICYNCLEFCKNCMNIYKVILKILGFYYYFYIYTKGLYPNYTKLSDCMTKCIKIIVLNFKTNRINIQRDMDIFR